MTISLAKRASSLTSRVEKRLFVEYGAVFTTKATPPPVVIFKDADHVERFQSTLALDVGVFGDHEIRLQRVALEALRAARDVMSDRGLSITARAADAGGRCYEDTVRLWTRNVTRGLEHWEAEGRITSEQAKSIRHLSPIDQVDTILDLEESEQLFFGTFFDKSILYSVAAPGASQHLAMVAFDVTEYENCDIDPVLARHGWHRTVPNDLPHFTYLGHDTPALPELGLRWVERVVGDRVYGFWTPDMNRLAT